MARQVRLPERCDVRNVTELHTQLVEALTGGDLLEIDATAVGLCDTAAAQLLAAAARDPHVRWRLSAALRAQLSDCAISMAFFKEAET